MNDNTIILLAGGLLSMILHLLQVRDIFAVIPLIVALTIYTLLEYLNERKS